MFNQKILEDLQNLATLFMKNNYAILITFSVQGSTGPSPRSPGSSSWSQCATVVTCISTGFGTHGAIC